MLMRLINIKNTKHSLSGAQLYEELLVGASLSTYDHWSTHINIS